MDRRTRYSPEVRERAVWFTDCDDCRTVLTFAGEGAAGDAAESGFPATGN